MRIFIIHGREFAGSEEFVRLTKALKSEGFEIWDPTQIPAGADWKSLILTEITMTEAYVVVLDMAGLSPSSLVELGAASVSKKPVFIVDFGGAAILNDEGLVAQALKPFPVIRSDSPEDAAHRIAATMPEYVNKS